MNQPAFHDVVQRPIRDRGASADVHPRLEGVFSSVFGSSNTLVSAAQFTPDVDIPPPLVSDVVPPSLVSDVDIPSGLSLAELKAAAARPSLMAIFATQYQERLTLLSEASKILGERVKARRTGPVQVLSKIAEDWQLSHTDLAGLLAYSDSQSASELLAGRISLRNPDREDRVRLLYRIYRVLSSLFPQVPQQQAWLRAPNPNLRNKSPLEFMMERRIPGMISVQNLVERLAGR